MRALFLAGCLVCAVGVCTPAADRSPAEPGHVILALARDNELAYLIGQYNPANKQWFVNTESFVPPNVQAPFTLFGAVGKLADVRVDEEFRTRQDIRPWVWDVSISTWDRSTTTLALAESGERPELAHPPQRLPLDDADAVATVADYLKAHHLDVPQPRITEAYRIDLNGSGQLVTLVCANSDNATFTTDAPAAVYALALLRVNVNGKPVTLPLRAQAVLKPERVTVDDFQRYHGHFALYQVLAVTDIAGDGEEQISILNNNLDYGPEVDLYGVSGNKIIHLLASRVTYF